MVSIGRFDNYIMKGLGFQLNKNFGKSRNEISKNGKGFN